MAALAGDWDAARDVQLDLPETGVCNSNPVLDADTIDSTGGGCCGAPAAETVPAPAGRGLATGISGGLLSAPLALLPVASAPEKAVEQGGGCCG